MTITIPPSTQSSFPASLIADIEPGTLPDNESVHFAHAMARVMRGLPAYHLTRYGEELVSLIERELKVPAISKIADKEKPAPCELRRVADQLAKRRARKSEVHGSLNWLSNELGLDQIEITILEFFARWSLYDSWRDLARKLPMSFSNPTPVIVARVLGLPLSIVDQRLAPNSALIGTGLLNDDRDGEFSPSNLLKRLIRSPAHDPEAWLQLIMPKAEQSSLKWRDFEHLGELRDVAANILSANEPVSILLYGAPGTGKTEFARALAEQVGHMAIFAGLTDDCGREPSRGERLSHLLLLRSLCTRMKGKLIIVDEADDVLSFHDRKNASKQWINRLVEAPQATTIWIVNDQHDLDRAVLRRMALAIGFDQPPLAARQRMVRRTAENVCLPLTDAEANEIAALKVSPAIVASGLRAAKLAGGGAEVAQSAIKGVMKALGQYPNPERIDGSIYNPALSSADTDLALLAERLEAAPMRGWSLLMSGQSGTGKSAFAHYLARRLGIEVEEKRCSDLMSPYVGETEINIAAAFAKAAERGALLLIDEADSLLYRREGAQRNWEVQQVNEMLVQMEHLHTPFVATTNLAQNLDPAVQRRFTMRVSFKPMTEAQASALFRAYFAQDWPTGVPVHRDQTPGDFGVVAQRSTLLGEDNPHVLLRWLREEIEARGGGIRAPMGFCVTQSNEPVQRMREQKGA